MRQKEKNLVRQSLTYLNKLDLTLIEKRHAGPGRKGKADLTGCMGGLKVELEAKVGDNKLSPLQEAWMRKWQPTGALCAGFWTFNELVWIIQNYESFKDSDSIINLPLDDEWRLINHEAINEMDLAA